MTERQAGGRATEGGAAVVEFVLVTGVAVVLALSLAQLGLFLWERNALMGSLSEGARVAATQGRTVQGGRWRMCWRCPQARSATQSPASS